VLLVAGCDIGQRVDPSAVALAEQEGDPTAFAVRYCGRMALGSPYQEVATRVVEVIRNAVRHLRQPRYATPERHPDLPAGWLMSTGWDFGIDVTLRVDVTGLGRPVFELIEREAADHGEQDLFRYGLTLVACTFTHGDRLTWSGGGQSVGKAYLCSRLQSLIRGDRLHAARTTEMDAMQQELLAYEIRVDPNANDRYGAFAVGAHDDMVTAVGLAVLEDREMGVTGTLNESGRWVVR